MMAGSSFVPLPPQPQQGNMIQDPRMMFQSQPHLQQPPPPPFHQHHQHQPPQGSLNPMMIAQQPPQAHLPPPHHNHNQGNLPPPINLKIILSKSEVELLFGYDGVLLNQLRQQTGANISITDPGPMEQVVTIHGGVELIFKAFSLICRKLWDYLQQGGGGGQRPLVLRLAVPASQCGSIIGKHGAKVKEIRDLTSANIQVSQESLPDSTERQVEISGSGESCLQCTYHICSIMQDAPLRGELVPYIPKGSMMGGEGMGLPNDPSWKPVFLCGDKAYIIDGDFARPAPPELLQKELAKTQLGNLASINQQNPASNNGQQPHQPDHNNPLALMHAALSNAQKKQGTGQLEGSEDPSLQHMNK